MRSILRIKIKHIVCLLVIMLLGIQMSFSTDASTRSTGIWDNIFWKLDFETGELILSGEGDTPRLPGVTVTNRYEHIPWYAYRDSIKSIIIEDGITAITDDIFLFHTNLAYVKIGKNVSKIFAGAFKFDFLIEAFDVHPENEYYTSVDGVLFTKDMSLLMRYPPAKEGAYVIPDSVTKVGGDAFEKCEQLTEITITPNVDTIGPNAFLCCTALTEVYIPDTVTTVHSGAFQYCKNVGELYISKSLTEIQSGAFCGLEKVKHIEIPRNVKKIASRGFADCTSLESVTMYRNITQVHLPFDGCENLKDIYYIGSEPDTHRLNIRPDHFFYPYTLHYGTSGVLPNGIKWELDSNKGILLLVGNGTLTGEENIWEEYGEVFYGVYVPEGITGIQNCLDSSYKSCGIETINGIEHKVYGRQCTITFKGNVVNKTLTKQFGKDLIIPYDIPHLEHYDFMGWTLFVNGYEAEYMWGDVFDRNVDTILYPIMVPMGVLGIEMEKLPKKTVYKPGEALDMTGAVLNVIRADGKIDKVTENFSVSGYNPSKEGRQKITVKHGDHKTTFYVTVEAEKQEPALTKIQPVVTKTEYLLGEKFDSSTLSLKLTYSDGSVKTIKSDFSVSGFSSESVGEVMVTVSYQGLSAKFEVLISEPTPPPAVDESEEDISNVESNGESDISLDESEEDISNIESEEESNTSFDEPEENIGNTESEEESNAFPDDSKEQSSNIESEDESDMSLDGSETESSTLPAVSSGKSSMDDNADSDGNLQKWWIMIAFAFAVIVVIALILRRRSKKEAA